MEVTSPGLVLSLSLSSAPDPDVTGGCALMDSLALQDIGRHVLYECLGAGFATFRDQPGSASLTLCKATQQLFEQQPVRRLCLASRLLGSCCLIFGVRLFVDRGRGCAAHTAAARAAPADPC